MKKIPVRHLHETRREPALQGDFIIRDVKALLTGKDMVQELHRHDFYYILALQKGKGSHIVDFVPYTIADRAVFFLRPGQVHQIVLDAGSAGFLVQFIPAFYDLQDKGSGQLLRKACSVNYYRPDVSGFQRLHTSLGNVFREFTEKREKYTDAIYANMAMFFIELIRQCNGCRPDAGASYMQERAEEFLTLLETHISEKKQVAQYAAMMNLSAYQLNTISKSVQGKTSSELINDHIILEAKRYLLATTNQVNQVADLLGYEDVSYFIRFFRKHTGYTPEAFRQNFR